MVDGCGVWTVGRKDSEPEQVVPWKGKDSGLYQSLIKEIVKPQGGWKLSWQSSTSFLNWVLESSGKDRNQGQYEYLGKNSFRELSSFPNENLVRLDGDLEPWPEGL